MGKRAEACLHESAISFEPSERRTPGELHTLETYKTSIAATTYTFAGVSNPWFAVRVKSNFEKTAAVALNARGLEVFLPTHLQKRQWSDRLKVTEVPLFPGYLFCRLNQDLKSLVLAAPGVIGIVSCGLRMLPVSNEEVESVRLAISGPAPVQPWPYLHAGDRVRVTQGSLAGVEGLVVEESTNCSRLVLQIHLLQRSISLQIDRDWIEPANTKVHAYA